MDSMWQTAGLDLFRPAPSAGLTRSYERVTSRVAARTTLETFNVPFEIKRCSRRITLHTSWRHRRSGDNGPPPQEASSPHVKT